MVKLPNDNATMQQSNKATSTTDTGFDPVTGAPTGGIGSKERELFQRQDELQLSEIRKGLELGQEVKEAGVELLTHEELELPPSVKQMGVTKIETEVNLPQTAPVVVPLADDQIVKSTGASVWASLTWLAQWCLRQLKKAHVKLKKVHGKIVRVVVK